MNFQRYALAMRTCWDKATFREKFEMIALDYDNLKYRGGRETPFDEGDCSATVSGPLYLMGFDIRGTADALYREIFTDPTTDYLSREDIIAIFYITKMPREHFGRTVPAGTATHVAPVVGRYVVVNAFDPIDLWTTKAVYEYYSKRGFNIEWRKLNMDNLIKHHEAKDLLWGLDDELKKIRGN